MVPRAFGVGLLLLAAVVSSCGRGGSGVPPAPAQLPAQKEPPARIAGIPPANAERWRRTLTKEVRTFWGWSKIAWAGAQVQQESSWRETAQSPYASGLGQQTPDTVKWLGSLYPADLGGGDPMNPHWSLRALVVYMRRMWDAYPVAGEENRLAFAYAAYNGGAGWVNRERKKAAAEGLDPDVWWENVERSRVRGERAFKENRDYPVKILRKWRPAYEARGW